MLTSNLWMELGLLCTSASLQGQMQHAFTAQLQQLWKGLPQDGIADLFPSSHVGELWMGILRHWQFVHSQERSRLASELQNKTI